jgi:lipopolysaccharide transport system ATP-binding protein
MMTPAIFVEGLGKRYNRYHAEKPITIMEAALAGLRRLKPVESFWALRDVSFTVAPGEMIGAIGKNGAGKSTLLQLIGGVGCADEGRIQVNGRIGALLDLGSGFSPDLTGRENAYIMAVVAGLNRREVSRRFDSIVNFAELEDFIDNPLRTYSTGMQMRLAFAVAIHTDPDVLLVDEFLSVGDLAFQAKCLQQIQQLKAEGCAIVWVSHDVDRVAQLCDRALWLRNGQVVAYGEPRIIAGQYSSEMRSQTRKLTPKRPPELSSSGRELNVNENRFGSLEVEIKRVSLFPEATIRSSDPLQVEIEYFASQAIAHPVFSVTISREDNQICVDTNTSNTPLPLSQIEGKGCIQIEFDRLDLNEGEYFVDVGVYEQNWSHAYDYHWHVYPLIVQTKTPGKGLLNPPHHWHI